LVQVGDPLARKVFNEEVAKRFLSGHLAVMTYLKNGNYLEGLSVDELDVLLKAPIFNKIEMSENNHNKDEKMLQDCFIYLNNITGLAYIN